MSRISAAAFLVAVLGMFLPASPAAAQSVSSASDCDVIFGVVDATDFINDQGELDTTGYLIVYTQSTAQVTATNNSAFTICVAGLEPGSNLTITLDGTVVLFNGPFDPNATIGGVSWNADLMAITTQLTGLSCGPHTLTAVGTSADGEPFNQTVNFTVECPPVPPTVLPVTGSDAGPLVAVGATLLVLGAGLYYGMRQRNGLTA